MNIKERLEEYLNCKLEHLNNDFYNNEYYIYSVIRADKTALNSLLASEIRLIRDKRNDITKIY